MNQATSLSMQDSRRAEARIATISLELEIRKSRPFNLGTFHSCAFVDINMGGVGIVSDIMNLRVLDRVDLRVHHNQKNYYVRGVIGFRQEVSGGVHYGIIFVNVPGELDMHINRALEGNDQDFDTSTQMEPGATTILFPGTQRRIDIRRTSPVMSIRVRKSGLLSTDLEHEVAMVDISKYGIGFVSDSFQCELMEEVDLTLDYKGVIFIAKGTVCYNSKSDGGYHYGIEFSQVSPEYIQLFESF